MKVKELIALLSKLENQDATIGLHCRIEKPHISGIYPIDQEDAVVIDGLDRWTGEPEAYYLQTIVYKR